MKKIIFFFLLIPLFGFAQITDDFEDGNITGWTESVAGHWTASNSSPLNGIYSLHHNFDNTIDDKDMISIPLTGIDISAGTTTWQFQLKHNYDQSSNNNWACFLFANANSTQMFPSGIVNGYVLGVDYNTSDDFLKLWKVNNGTITEVINTNFNWDASITPSTTPGLKITRTSSGLWSIYLDSNGGFDNLVQVGYGATDIEFTTASYFGFYYKYIANQDLKFWADDVSISGASGNDNDSQITAGASPEPTTISSLVNSSVNSIMVFDVKFTDLASGDNFATIIDQINFTQGSANDVADWTNAIAGAKLVGTDISTGLEGVVSSNGILFSGSNFISVADGTNETYQLFVWLKTDLSNISDNDILEFKLEYNNVTCNNSGSTFGSGIVESGDINNAVNITATKLIFKSIPTIVPSSTSFSAVVWATDANNNLDLDATNQVTLSRVAGAGTLSSSEGLVKNLSNGIYTWTTLQYNVLESFSILAQASGLSSITSSLIECTDAIYYLKDDFEDGDILGWTESQLAHWGASSANAIHGNYSLKHVFATTITANYTDIVTHQIQPNELSSEKKFWRFSVLYPNINPSSTNDWHVYLMTAEDQTLISSANGYVLGLNSSDVICLFSLSSGSLSEIINTGLTWNSLISSNNISFEVSRDVDGTWNVKIDTDGGFDNLTTYGNPIVNLTNTAANYFSIRYRFTKTNAGLISFDDIYYGPEIPDTEPPHIISVTALSNSKLQVLFSEEVSEITAENTANYFVNNSIGNPTSATLDQVDSRIVNLQFAGQFTEGTTYQITLQNIQDLNSNILVSVSKNFVYNRITVTSMSVISANQINVYFSKDVDAVTAETLTNYSVNNSIGNPSIANVDITDKKMVHLTFSTNFVLENQYSITIQNIEDLNGNSIVSSNFNFFYYVVQKYDIVINELMIDVNPLPVALPGYKYIEIFNNSNYDINLANWTLAIGTNTPKAFPDFNLESYKYAIICETTSEADFKLYGKTIPILTSSYLTSTSGKNVIIYDNTGKIIEDITYSPAWYNNIDKEEGGWSIERIDPDNVCNQNDNWVASVNYIGGTPGRINSVFANNPDIEAPYITKADFYSARGIVVQFSEIVDTLTALNFSNYIINNSFTAFSGTVDENDKSIIRLVFAENFAFGQNSIIIRNIADYCGNIMQEYSKIFSYELIHPKAIEVKSQNQAIVYFSENVDKINSQNVSNYWVDNNIGYPLLAIRDANDSSKVHLQFEIPFTQDVLNSMSFYNISDIFGNLIVNTDLSFAYHVTKPFDIVINELMLDVNPAPVGLPAQQYIELYNTSNFEIWLSDWTFRAESQSDRIFPVVSIPAKGYAIMCVANYASDFSEFNNVIPILSSSDLTQTGKTLIINDNWDNLVYSIDYSSDWYQDNSKEDGGWSLEKIDPMNYCGEISNWKASNAVAGGTPEAVNSVFQENPDNTAPKLLEIEVVASNHVYLRFSENISLISKFDTLNYFVNANIGNPSFVTADDTSNSVVHLYFNNQFNDNTENLITVENIYDDCGNLMENTTLPFTYNLIYPQSIWVQNSKQIQVKFSEVVDYITGADVNNYTIDNSTINPEYAVRDAANPSVIYLQFTNEFSEGQTNKLSISGINDINGNTIKDAEFEFTYYLAKANDIVINEILFNPLTGGYDFVELYNRSNYPIDLININIAKRDEITNIVESIYSLSSENKILEPHSYIVITEDSTTIKTDYETAGTFVQLATMPSFPDDEGNVVIIDSKDSIIDDFTYSSKMHFALLNDENGVSLERVDYEKATNEASNWHSAAENVGFATPGYQNSQYKSDNVIVEKEITIEPEVFSPDNDGFDDVLSIHYEFDEPGKIANIRIYDSKGRFVRDLVDNELLSVKGIINWDGLDNGNEKVRIGIYIIYIEVFDMNANVKHYKKTCVVATMAN